jgi:hypothetical protein
MKPARLWVAAFCVVLAVFGFGQLEAWPFTSWYMFSHVEPQTIRIAEARAVAPHGTSRSVVGLPLGLASHRLLARFKNGDGAAVCRELLRVARAEAPAERVDVFEKSWRPLVRNGDRPANVSRSLIATCR